MNPIEKLKNYFESEADSIQARYSQSSTTGHPNDVGGNREDILINFFNRHLPHKFKAVRGGKIFDSDGRMSNQVDVVIYDNTVPRLGSQNNTLYLAEGVVTAIEVKPKLTKDELKLAIKNLESIKQIKKKIGAGIVIGNYRNDVYCGIFSFESSLDFKGILETIDSKIGNKKIIDFIAVNNQHLILRNTGEWKTNFPDGRVEKIDVDYLNFNDGKLNLYKFLMLICREIGKAQLAPINLENYINLDFTQATSVE